MDPKKQQMIAAGGLLLCLLIGGGIIWFFMFGSSPRHRTVEIDPKTQGMDLGRGGPMYRAAPPRPRNGIIQTGSDTWQVLTPTGGMNVSKDASGSYKIAYFFSAGVKPPTDQVALMAARVRIVQDAAMAKEWGVTPEQVEKLKTVRGGSGLNPSAAERAAIEQFWMSYISAATDSARNDAQKKIADKLEEIAKANVDAAKKAYAERVDQVKSILTSEQVAKITKP